MSKDITRDFPHNASIDELLGVRPNNEFEAELQSRLFKLQEKVQDMIKIGESQD